MILMRSVLISRKRTCVKLGCKKALDNGRIGAVFSHSRSDNTFDEQVKKSRDINDDVGFRPISMGRFTIWCKRGRGN